MRGAWVEIIGSAKIEDASMSLPVRGAWVEITRSAVRCAACARRSPCGERGLKYRGRPVRPLSGRSLPVRGAWVEISKSAHGTPAMRSLPVRGAWVEMSRRTGRLKGKPSRSPCGERGLKSLPPAALQLPECRSPCGERGLKWARRKSQRAAYSSLPVRGAWVEMASAVARGGGGFVAPRAGSVG